MRTLFLPLAACLAALVGCVSPGGGVPPLPLAAAAPAAPVELTTSRGTLRTVPHPAAGAASAALMLGGARGGIDGPSGLYPLLAARLGAEGVATLRLEYHRPADLAESVRDARAALGALERAWVRRVGVLGWSFGGAVAITAAARSGLVVGVATFASQGAGTEAAPALAPRSLLLFHGTADRVLGDTSSRGICERAREPKELVILPGEGHHFIGGRDALADRVAAWALPLLKGREETAGTGRRAGG